MEVNNLINLKLDLLTEKLNDAENFANVEPVTEIDKTIFENLKWLTSSEAVAYLRIPSLNALRQLVYRRKIPFYKLGRRLLFNKAELDLFVISNPIKRINK